MIILKILGLQLYILGSSRNIYSGIYSHLTCAIIILKPAKYVT